MPMIGQPAPQFVAPALVDGGDFKEINLSDYKGKFVVLFFYPLDFTALCPTEITQFRELSAAFKAENAEIIGCSVDSVHAHKRWVHDDLKDLGFPLLGDVTKRVARDYGVLLEDKGVAARATYVIDPEGRIQHIGINPLSVGRDANDILRVVQALKSGELCGAGWKKGAKSIGK